jgi:hypothetical protein
MGREPPAKLAAELPASQPYDGLFALEPGPLAVNRPLLVALGMQEAAMGKLDERLRAALKRK